MSETLIALPETTIAKSMTPAPPLADLLADPDSFVRRHIGPSPSEIEQMLQILGASTLDELIDTAIPEQIRMREKLRIPDALSEFEALATLKAIATKNQVFRSFIGMGYYDTI